MNQMYRLDNGSWHTRLGALLAGVLSLLLGGCASVAPPTIQQLPEIPMEARERTRLLEAGTISLANLSGPPYEFRMHAEATALVFGPAMLVGGSSADKMQSEEDQSKLGLVDPVEVVTHRFSSRVSSGFPQLKVHVVDRPLGSGDPGTLRATVTDRHAVLFQTTIWQAFHEPQSGLGSYRIAYGATAKMIRVDDGVVVWQSGCSVLGKDATNMHRMRADGGALLKQALAQAAESCADEIWGKFSGFNAPSANP
jgi:hypothetical protein